MPILGGGFNACAGVGHVFVLECGIDGSFWPNCKTSGIKARFHFCINAHKQQFVYFNYNGYHLLKTILCYKQNFCIRLLCLSLSMVRGLKDGRDAQKLLYGEKGSHSLISADLFFGGPNLANFQKN